MSKNVDTIYYLTPLQRGMLHHSRMDPESGVYVEQFSCVLKGSLDIERFRHAWETVAHRHDVLKTLFIRLHEERPMQVVRKNVVLPFETLDWSGFDVADQQRRFDILLADDRARGFDWSVAPLMRLTLAVLGHYTFRFLWTYHHAILDGWSMPILLNEVFQFYARPDNLLPAPSTDFRHYVAWHRVQDTAQARKYWQETLKGFRTPLSFCASMAPALGQLSDGRRRLATVSRAMSSEWTTAATKLCRDNKLTMNTLCQGAWSALLGRYSDSDDVVYGMVMSGRSPEIDAVNAIAGLFINTLPARVRLDGELDTMEWLHRIQSTTQQAERYAYSSLTDVLQCSALPRQRALFESLYVFENYPGQEAFGAVATDCGLAIEELHAVEETNYPLALIVLPQERLTFQLTYDTARFDGSAISRMADQYRALLERMLLAEGCRVGDLHLQAACVSSSHKSAEPPAGADSLLAMIARHADGTPDRLAFSASAIQCTGSSTLTLSASLNYSMLRSRIVQAIWQWHRLGYLPGDRVLVLCKEPVAGLVILLSGLAYGVDCVLPDPELSVDTLTSSAKKACGPEQVRGCVSTASSVSIPGMQCDVFVERDPVDGDGGERAGDLSMPTTADSARGACSLLGRSELGAWKLLRYHQSQLIRAAESFSRTYPANSALDMALCCSPLAHSTIWTALAGLCAGLSLHHVGCPEEEMFLPMLASPDMHWHSIVLLSTHTRRIGRAAATLASGTIDTDYWITDACGLTQRDARRLEAIAPGARVMRELRWPAQSLAHSTVTMNEPADANGPAPTDVGVSAIGTVIGVLDRHLHPAGVDARGHLAIAGWTVPDMLLSNGKPDLDAWISTREGVQLRTGLRAWMTEAACQTELPNAEATLDTLTEAWVERESELATRAAVSEVAIVERVSDAGDWECAVYYSGRDGAPTGEYAERIREASELCGIHASACVELSKLPRNECGVDRLSLLHGDVAPLRKGADLAPRDAVESAIHEIWSVLLNCDRIGIHDSYFDLGGDSLQATVMLYQIEEKLRCKVDMETLLERPTIAGLAEAISSGSDGEGRAQLDLSADAILEDDIVPANEYRPRAYQQVLLTGATGFLGVHLLAELLKSTQARVHCLVRATDEASGFRRLVDALKEHGLWDENQAARIVAVPGDLGLARLGMSERAFSALARDIDAIYHNGALVNFVYPYSSLKQVNVVATRDVLRLASLHRTKPVHYVSTVGTLDRFAESIPETLAVGLHDRLMSGYEQSKWVAEQTLSIAAQRGLPVTIYRPSRIVGHSGTGRMNVDDLFCRLIKGIVLFGKAPRDTGFDNMLPVDLVSRIIVKASLQPTASGKAVHVINPQWNSMDALVDFIESEGYAIQRMDYEGWLDALTVHVRHDQTHPLAMLIPVLKKLNPVVDPSVGRQLPIAIDHLNLLAGDVISEGVRPVNEWLRVYFDYFYNTGYLARPASGLRAPASSGNTLPHDVAEN
ncbi:NAD-dependent epimerase/dehydratase family protein [Paraburkholderia panacisoli]|uniref:NAD-dependent epimerase/dehydratase family protein n=1 Tax=Paraburkholderia panacisoli TaxID=2603818 RepID=A0A5B0GPD1_9BURK|nr:thioester reductase domain-containing protein [Paraburkholderia panacisoli]KAA1003860.1 NAD-dependent epimerase/dehydratase family protein [Paraburkholderia panacisoli]